MNKSDAVWALGQYCRRIHDWMCYRHVTQAQLLWVPAHIFDSFELDPTHHHYVEIGPANFLRIARGENCFVSLVDSHRMGRMKNPRDLPKGAHVVSEILDDMQKNFRNSPNERTEP